MIQNTTFSPISDVSEVCGLGATGMMSHQKAQAVPAAAEAMCLHVLAPECLVGFS